MISSSSLSSVAKASFVLLLIWSLYYSFPNTSAVWSSQFSPLFSSKPHTFTNVATIIEDRPLSNLAPLLLHFSSVLGPTWPIVLFTSENNLLNQSISFQRAVSEGRISIRSLPLDVHFENHRAVSELLTAPWLWKQLAPAGHVLLFQADSILCANSDKRVDDYLQYDFVGAPIEVPAQGDDGHGEGFNGGLSLRNRTMILDIVTKSSWKTEINDGTISQEADPWFQVTDEGGGGIFRGGDSLV
ncbi:hypothetical protein BKA65DRAFT_527027 [Rhexocercosporidium sp. MPI-PUGE-AT-0058]|nr:hypothetical protein BKA65DRAFT_527027 [Rhexocercosporidium sp. MPI-PUGE-AT-0058]